MSWRQKKAELLFNHKLEVKRIWLNRGIAFISILATVAGAYFLAPKFAQELKLEEFEHQKELEIAKEWESHAIAMAIEGHAIIDSAHQKTFQTYLDALGYFERIGDSADFYASSVALRISADKFLEVSNKYSMYFDPDLSEQAQANAIMLRSVASLPSKSDWSDVQPFLADLAQIRWTLQWESFRQRMRGDRGKTRTDLFRIEIHQSETILDARTNKQQLEILNRNVVRWEQWRKRTVPQENNIE